MKVPKGDKFLPDVEMDELKRLHKNEKDPKARDRLLACMARKNGDSMEKIARSMNRVKSTIFEWLDRAQSGLDNIYDIKRPGPRRRLDAEQLAQIKEDLLAGPRAHGFETEMWTGKLLARHIHDKYGVDYVPRTMQEMMHEMGFRHIKPRPRNPGAATDEQKNEFKKKLQH